MSDQGEAKIRNLLTDIFGSDVAKMYEESKTVSVAKEVPVIEDAEIILSLTKAEAKALTIGWAVVAAALTQDAVMVAAFARLLAQKHFTAAESLTDKMSDLSSEVHMRS